MGTSTITSTLAPSTAVSSTLVPANQTSGGGTSLSTGAKAGIIAGSVVGGLAILALVLACCILGRRRRSTKKAEDEAIRWPEIAASAEDRAALYPEPIHKTGRAGIGGDEMEEVGDGMGALAGAGAAGAAAGYGAGAYAATRYPSTRQPTLPSVPPSVYDSESFNRAYSPPPGSAGHTGMGPQHSYLNEAAVAPGPAAIDYQRTTPSPPRTYMGPGSESEHHMLANQQQNGFSNGGSPPGHGSSDDAPPGAGALPLPGSDDGGHQYYAAGNGGAAGPSGIDRPLSPHEIGAGYNGGYDQDGAQGGRWRLSVVNDDRDPYYR